MFNSKAVGRSGSSEPGRGLCELGVGELKEVVGNFETSSGGPDPENQGLRFLDPSCSTVPTIEQQKDIGLLGCEATFSRCYCGT
ncbi:hypothetical protein GBA52_025770 [Prunus armeniaca]|nr:hypothetical protein GBA52_025770 [Prunus armeniaca]